MRQTSKGALLTAAPVRVRAATPGDAETMARVWEAAWLDGHRGHVPAALLAARSPEYFATQAAGWSSVSMLAVDDTERIFGLAVVVEDELVQLAVDRTVRRHGVGAVLLDAAERRIGAAYRDAWLAVVPGNTRARRFYEQHGWNDTGPVTYNAPAHPHAIAVPVRRYAKTLSKSGEHGP